MLYFVNENKNFDNMIYRRWKWSVLTNIPNMMCHQLIISKKLTKLIFDYFVIEIFFYSIKKNKKNKFPTLRL